MFLLKRACNLQLSRCVCGRLIKNATLIQLRQTPTQHFPVQFKAPHSSHAVSLFYSFILHLSFSYAHWQMCFTLFTFFTLYPQHNQVPSSIICDNQLAQTEMEKSIKVSKASQSAPAPPKSTRSPSLRSWPCKLLRSLKRYWGYCLGKKGTIWMSVVCALLWKTICGSDSRIKGI